MYLSYNAIHNIHESSGCFLRLPCIYHTGTRQGQSVSTHSGKSIKHPTRRKPGEPARSCFPAARPLIFSPMNIYRTCMQNLRRPAITMHSGTRSRICHFSYAVDPRSPSGLLRVRVPRRKCYDLKIFSVKSEPCRSPAIKTAQEVVSRHPDSKSQETVTGDVSLPRQNSWPSRFLNFIFSTFSSWESYRMWRTVPFPTIRDLQARLSPRTQRGFALSQSPFKLHALPKMPSAPGHAPSRAQRPISSSSPQLDP